MTTYNVEIVVHGKDNASGPLRSAGGALSNIGQIAAGILAAGIFQKLADGLANFAMNGIKNASSLNESINKTRVVFGDSADSMLKWSESSATALGLSQQKALDAAAGFAVFGKAAGLAGQDVIDFSQQGLARAADMASIFNTTVEEAALAMQAAFRGETEPIRKYGVMLDDATMRAKALELGIISNTKNALTPQQKVLAANALIMQQTSFTAGDFANTSDQLANSQRILDAQLENAGAQLGTIFLPAITRVMGFVNTQAIPIIQDLIKTFSDLAGPVLSGATDAFTSLNLGSLVSQISNFGGKLSEFISVLGDQLRPGLVSFGAFFQEQGPVIQRISDVMLAKFAEVAQWFSAQVLPFLVLQFNKLGAWFQANGPLIARFGGVVAAIFGGILITAQTLWVGLAPILNGLIAGFLNFATFIMQLFTGDFAGAFTTWKNGFAITGETIKAVFTDLAAWVTGWFGTDWAAVMAQWGAFFAGLQQKWDEGIAGWQRFFGGVFDSAIAWAANIGSALQVFRDNTVAQWDAFWVRVNEQAEQALSEGIAGWQNFFAGVSAAISSWWKKLTTTWSANFKMLNQITAGAILVIAASITAWLNNMLMSITTFAANLLLQWQSAWNALADALGSAAGLILDAAATLFKNVIDGIYGMLGDFASIGAAIVQSIQAGLEAAWVSFIAWITERIKSLIGDLLGTLLPKPPEPPGSESFGVGGYGAGVSRFGQRSFAPAHSSVNTRSATYNFGGTTVYQVVAPQTGRNLLKGFD